MMPSVPDLMRRYQQDALFHRIVTELRLGMEQKNLKPLDLKDGVALAIWLYEHKQAKLSETDTPFQARVRAIVQNSPDRKPECPICGGAMAMRTNRTEGTQFWGCKAYPKCKGTRPSYVETARRNGAPHVGREDRDTMADYQLDSAAIPEDSGLGFRR